MNCFCCGGKLSQRQDGDYDCEGCKRVLYKIDGDWATRRRKIKLTKMPEPGDNYDDCIEKVE